MNEIERMLYRRLYDANDPELRDSYIRAKRLVHVFNRFAYSNRCSRLNIEEASGFSCKQYSN